MHDKTVRRRRAVLLGLVVLSLLLLTAYFGESPNGRLHSVQRGFLTVVSPLQDGANKVLTPVRNLFGWVGDTLHAKSQRDELRKQLDILRREKTADEGEKRTYKELLALVHLNQLSLSQYHPVAATVISASPSIWYETVVIDEGEGAGIHANDPVVNAEGLVGRVATVASDGAVVDLLTDSSMAVSARIGMGAATGLIEPKVGEPNDLLLEYLPGNAPAVKGESVVSSGTVDPGHDSFFPPGILIGQVTSVNEEGAYRSVNVSPAVNLHNLSTVEVLTSGEGTRAFQVSHTATSLPAEQEQSTTGTTASEQLASTGAGG